MDRLGGIRWTLLVWAGVLVAACPLPEKASAQTTRSVSVSSDGCLATGGSPYASVVAATSADGHHVAFVSDGAGLVPNDPSGTLDVFVHDLVTGETRRVNVDSDGIPGSGPHSWPAISANGRFIAFGSFSTTLVANDTNEKQDVFVHDQMTSITTRVSVDSTGAQASDASRSPSLSADGRFVAFASDAPDLVSGDTNGVEDIFVHDRDTGITTRVSVDSDGNEGDGLSGQFPSISADGRFVTFPSLATNLVPGDTNDLADIFVHDRDTGLTTRVSVDSDGNEGNAHADFLNHPAPISADGRFVAFNTFASNLVAGDTNGTQDVFVHDRETGITSRVSVDSDGNEGDGRSRDVSISVDGRFVTFESEATNLVDDDTNGAFDVFVHDRDTGMTIRVSVDMAGRERNEGGKRPSPSGDATLVAFESDAQLVLPYNVINGMPDIFARDLGAPGGCEAGVVNAGAGSVADVLLINGSAGDQDRIRLLNAGQPIQIRLDASPSGPGDESMRTARYVVWVWAEYPVNPYRVRAKGEVLGCTVNPTPFQPLAWPQPIRCIRGTGIRDSVCGDVRTLGASPVRAPWAFTRSAGLPPRSAFTFQGILEDDGAANSLGFSVTNAVIARRQF